MSTETKKTSSKPKLFKIVVSAYLSFVTLFIIFNPNKLDGAILFFGSFGLFASVITTIIRSMLKTKKETGSWFTPGCPCCHNHPSFQKTHLTTSVFHPNWNTNPLNPGSGAWHVLNDRR